jgi:sodium transport system permease protein
MLVVMIASMAGVIPSVNLDYRTSLIPLVNVSLLVKQVLAQQLNYYLAGITILVNAMCSIIVIWIIARIYNSEDVLFNEGFNSFRLFQKRSDMKKGTVPATGDIIMCLAVVLILMVYISVIVGTRSVFGATVVTQLMIMATPLLVTWYMKSDVKKLFCLKRSDARKSLVCILIYIGTFILVNILSVALTQIFSESTENIELLYSEFLEQPFPILVLVMAFMPAIGEELLFRGLVLGSLKDKYGARTAIIVSAIIFGAYHTSLVKFIPTMLLGLCLAFSVEYTGSIYISMLLHFLNNYISVIGMKLM